MDKLPMDEDGRGHRWSLDSIQGSARALEPPGLGQRSPKRSRNFGARRADTSLRPTDPAAAAGMPGELLRNLTPPFTLTLGKSKPRKPSSAMPTPISPQQSHGPRLYLISHNDEVYENDILRTPGSIKPWLDYASFKRQHGTALEQSFVLERACAALPRSYKLWKLYLELRVNHLKGKSPARHKTEYQKVNALFERALVLLNKMPRIWEMYLAFLCQQPLITFTRRTFDRALRALPLTQHARIWKLYRPFANSAGGETAVKIWRRYVQLHPEQVEDFIDVLVKERKFTEAVQQYIEILNNPKFRSTSTLR